MITLKNALELDNGGVISLVGAGGKTSLIFSLANELIQCGYTVCTTTTTKMINPLPEHSTCVIVTNNYRKVIQETRDSVNDFVHVTIASAFEAGSSKLVGFRPDLIDELHEANVFDWILVEADGAKQRPLKAPLDYEPVIPESSSTVISLIGLDAIGKPLNDENVFRKEQFEKISGLSLNEPVTVESIVNAVCHKEGLFKGTPENARGYLYLNKADIENAADAGKKCVDLLLKKENKRPKRVIIGSAREFPFVTEWHDI